MRFLRVLWVAVLVTLVAFPALPAGTAPDARVEEYQRLLKEAGYYRGAIDGIAGPLTRQAILRFQRDQGLTVDGVVGPSTLAALRRAAATYVVRKGDTLHEIAARFGVSAKWLATLNGLRDPDLIRPGQKLLVREVSPAGSTKGGSGSTAKVRSGGAATEAGSGGSTTRAGSPGPASPTPPGPPSPARDTVSGWDEDPAWQTFLPGAAPVTGKGTGLQGARIALTFNDAPHENTAPVLDVLARHRAKATFFLVGDRVGRWRDQVQRLARDGHALGNHSYSHRVLTGHGRQDVENDLAAAQAAIAAVTGQLPRYFRPPGGAMDSTVATAAASQGLTIVLWHNVGATDDLALPPEELARRIASRCRDGYIVMLHADRPGTAAVVDNLVTLLTAAGARLVTLSELGAP